MNGDSVTVRPVRGMDTQDQAIIKAAYSANPVRTGGVTDYAEVPDGFLPTLPNGWWIPSGGRSVRPIWRMT